MPVEVMEVSGLKPKHVSKCLSCKHVIRLKYPNGPLYAGIGIIKEVWESTSIPKVI